VKRLALLSALLLLAPAALHAQADQQLQQAIRLYESLEIEQARVRFQQVISPSSPFAVTEVQRVVAYKYLGATYAQLGQTDSALVYFVGALQRDPLTDLDPRSFTAAERDVFADAKRRLFKVGMRPLPRDTISPQAEERVAFPIATTHNGMVRLELVGATDDQRYVLFEGELDGPRDIQFTGRNPRGSGFIPPGVYDVVLTGESRSLPPPAPFDSVSALLEITHIVAPLEDTLQALGPNDTLPTRRPASAATKDLLLGLGIAAGSLIAANFIGASDLDGSTTAASGVAVLGVSAGVWAFFHRRSHPEIPENIRANAVTRSNRAETNAAIMVRNTEKINATRLALRPLGQ
jgi:hypothetical protein